MLETACEDFEILQRLIRQETKIISSHHRDNAGGLIRIQMALAKSFVFFVVRARRICEHGQRSLRIDRLERTRFIKGTQGLLDVRDVNEHGFDANGSSKPSMHRHEQESAIVDETAMLVLSDNNILMGPLNLYDMYVPTARMRGLAGWASLYRTTFPERPKPPLVHYLATLTDRDHDAANSWMNSYNAELGCIPAEKARGSAEGLAEVVAHLETLIARKKGGHAQKGD